MNPEQPIYGKLTRDSRKDLNDAFQRWCRETGQHPAPTFAVVASVGVASGAVKMRFLDHKQYLKLQKYITRILK